MRPNQQNMNKQRSRGRNNNQRRGGGGNPLSRNYESNGPDVKIRGNASHIAEKYTQLARDAAASGDNVMAENYLQHAEHYNRIILAAQAQIQPRPEQQAEVASEDENAEETSKVEAQPQSGEASQPSPEAGEESKPRRTPRQRRPRREPVEETAQAASPGEGEPAQAAEPEPVAANGADDADKEKPKRAVRRTTRRTTKATEPEAASELPAFLTAGREAAAE